MKNNIAPDLETLEVDTNLLPSCEQSHVINEFLVLLNQILNPSIFNYY